MEVPENSTHEASGIRKLKGCENFVRNNPLSDKFDIRRFRHIEFYTTDATNAYKRFMFGLGMSLSAKSDLSTGNEVFASYAITSGECTFIFTSPYNNYATKVNQAKQLFPTFDTTVANRFVLDHGLAARVVGIEVGDAEVAYNISTSNGAIGKLPPISLIDTLTNTALVVSEIQLFGDTIIRFMSGNYFGTALPNYVNIDSSTLPRSSFASSLGITRLDHCVSNVPELFPAVDYICKALGLHEFGEFTAADVGSLESGLNTIVLANNNEFILMPVNEPTYGTKRKSQIETYLEQHNGPGVQHIAVLTNNIIETVREMQNRSSYGGFDFMPPPVNTYYKNIKDRIHNEQIHSLIPQLEELGILVDEDDQGTLLQIFTAPIGDRNTCWIEIIQRIGCDVNEYGGTKEQTGGCGGFGKGNFSELFRCMEEFERLQELSARSCSDRNR